MQIRGLGLELASFFCHSLLAGAVECDLVVMLYFFYERELSAYPFGSCSPK